MSVIDAKNRIEVAQPLIPGLRNMPLDARTVCDSTADFPNIAKPYLGMIIFTKSDKKYWKVTELKSDTSGLMPVANALIKEYEEFNSGGGAEYVSGDGLELDPETNTFSVDFDVVARKGDIVTYHSSLGLKLSDANYFSVDFDVVAAKSEIVTYKQGDNITIATDGTISATDTKYSNGDGLKLDTETNTFSVDFSVVAKKGEIPEGGTTDYNALVNKPVFEGADGISVTLAKAVTLRLSGAGNEASNGDYVLLDAASSGTARVWQKDGRYFYHDGERWLVDNNLDSDVGYYYAEGTTDPWLLKFKPVLEDFGTAPTIEVLDNGTSDKYTVTLKGVPVYDDSTKNIEGLYIDADGLHCGLGHLVPRSEFESAIGNIDLILDNINGEVV